MYNRSYQSAILYNNNADEWYKDLICNLIFCVSFESDTWIDLAVKYINTFIGHIWVYLHWSFKETIKFESFYAYANVIRWTKKTKNDNLANIFHETQVHPFSYIMQSRLIYLYDGNSDANTFG